MDSAIAVIKQRSNEEVMNKINGIDKAEEISKKLRKGGKSIVLAGGCFDLLHIGHIRFLKEAKKYGFLFILLESDESIGKLKGKKRPIIPVQERAEILSSISYVDYVIPLKGIKNNNDYNELVGKIKPDFIAITKGDLARSLKEKQAKDIGAKIIEVTDRIKDKSSSKLAEIFRNY
ncbi:MAG: hypothetical protein A2152_03830 [Candidatus Levybacteria bacterium RBG_16_35_6]|nr:MAG: hypothetical protein A2152_03830 [Candidatus Levybacteria bacterium RBG_16_35_6]